MRDFGLAASSTASGAAGVASLAFGTVAGRPVLACGGARGSVTLWDLNGARIASVLPDAHDGPVRTVHFLAGEPVLVSAGADNAVKEWIFDSVDGGHRLLRFRAGHAAPPTTLRHYGDHRLLSAGCDRSFRVFSTIQDQQSRELSQGSVERRAKRLKVKTEELRLPQVIALDAGQVRERDWANVVTAHAGDPRAYTWRLAHASLGQWTLFPPRDREDTVASAPVSSVSLSCCGNFAFVGSDAGRLDKYNMQSGLHRGAFERRAGRFARTEGVRAFVGLGETPETNAHTGRVVGVSSDALNKIVVSAGADGTLRVWAFKTRKLTDEIRLDFVPTRMAHHRAGALVALSAATGDLVVLDSIACAVVRRFKGHRDRVTDLAFSSDGRWLLSASMDGTTRVWDVVHAQCLQVVPSPWSMIIASY